VTGSNAGLVSRLGQPSLKWMAIHAMHLKYWTIISLTCP
jgi:hypothetical protein